MRSMPALTQRFVDRRTTVLMRQIGADAARAAGRRRRRGRGDWSRTIRSAGSRASASPSRPTRAMPTSACCSPRPNAAWRRARAERARALAAAADAALSLAFDDERPAGDAAGDGDVVATLGPGPTLVRPRVLPDRALDCLDRRLQAKISGAAGGIGSAASSARRLPALIALDALQRDPAAGAPLRARWPPRWSTPAASLARDGRRDRDRRARSGRAASGCGRSASRSARSTCSTHGCSSPARAGGGGCCSRRGAICRRTAGATRRRDGARSRRGRRDPDRTAIARSAPRRCASILSSASPAPRMMRAPAASPSRPIPRWRPRSGVTPATLARLMAALGFRAAPAARKRGALGVARHRPRQGRRRRRATTHSRRSPVSVRRVAEGESMRLDRFLWFARLAKTRSAAQTMAEAGTSAPRRPPDRPRACAGPGRVDARLHAAGTGCA